MWKAVGLLYQGFILAMTGKAADAVSALTSGMAGLRSTGATVNLPLFSSILAGAYRTSVKSMRLTIALSRR
jgi:hypothetical protein